MERKVLCRGEVIRRREHSVPERRGSFGLRFEGPEDAPQERGVKAMKRKLLFLAAAVICLSIAATGTLAYFNQEYRQTNVITTGSVDIKLNEWTYDDEGKKVPFENLNGVMPGTSVTKIPEVVNTGKSDAWIRVKVEKKILLDGKEEISPEEVEKLISLDINEAWWTYQDGYYYYNGELEPTKTTEPVFTKVSLSKDMDNRFKNATITVDVIAQAVQVANNGNSATEASGWPTEGQSGTDTAPGGSGEPSGDTSGNTEQDADQNASD